MVRSQRWKRQVGSAFALIGLTALGLLTNTRVSIAQPAEHVMEDFGLLGSWALDCSKPEARDNVYTVFRRETGGVRRTYHIAPNTVSGDALIKTARRLSEHQIEYDLVTANNERLTVTLMKAGNRIQVWASRNADGKKLVTDGVRADNGSMTSIQTLCSR